MAYVNGTTIELPVTFKVKATGVLTDPASVTLKLRKPNGSALTYTYPSAQVVKDAVGTYRGIVVVDVAGEWLYEWVATGTPAGVQRDAFTVEPSITDTIGTIDLCTVDDVRDFLQKPAGDDAQDAIIAQLITRASSVIQQHCEREFAPAPVALARTFPYDGAGILNLTPFDLRAVTLVRVDSDTASPTTLLTTQYRLWPLPASGGVYLGLEISPSIILASRLWRTRLVEVTGNWGWPQVPPAVEHAAVVTVATWLRRDVSAFSSTFQIDEARLERPEAIPSSVIATLQRYKRRTYP